MTANTTTVKVDLVDIHVES